MQQGYGISLERVWSKLAFLNSEYDKFIVKALQKYRFSWEMFSWWGRNHGTLELSDETHNNEIL